MTYAIATKPLATPPISSVGLKTGITILERWGATGEQSASIFRISRSTYARAKRGEAVSLDRDQLTRVSLILNIHASLRILFDNPENLYGFMGMANHNEYFNGRSPLEVISSGDLISLYEVYRRIDALRGAGW